MNVDKKYSLIFKKVYYVLIDTEKAWYCSNMNSIKLNQFNWCIKGWDCDSKANLSSYNQGLVKGEKFCFSYLDFYFRHGEGTSTASQKVRI